MHMIICIVISGNYLRYIPLPVPFSITPYGGTRWWTHEAHNPRKKLDRAVQLVNDGKRFVLVLDNIDWEFKVHDMRSNKQNLSVHAVAISIMFDCVAADLPDNGPKKCLNDKT